MVGKACSLCLDIPCPPLVIGCPPPPPRLQQQSDGDGGCGILAGAGGSVQRLNSQARVPILGDYPSLSPALLPLPTPSFCATYVSAPNL